MPTREANSSMPKMPLSIQPYAISPTPSPLRPLHIGPGDQQGDLPVTSRPSRRPHRHLALEPHRHRHIEAQMAVPYAPLPTR